MNSQKPEGNTRDERKQNIATEDLSLLSTPPADHPLKAHSSVSNHRNDTHEDAVRGAAGLAVILGQMVAYFSGRANVDDTDVVCFSLHHLFCRVDYLYRTALPELLNCTPSTITRQSSKEDLSCHHYTWNQLRTIKHTLNRMEPLCNLLSDATKSILDALDLTAIETASSENTVPWTAARSQDDEQDWLQTLSHEHWEQALADLTECLNYWQQNYSQLALLANHFAQVIPAMPALTRLDEVFNIVIDSTGAIFGDILPGFQAISIGDDAAVATLLFDLMQQADQLLLQFDTALEPLHALIEQFALPSQR